MEIYLVGNIQDIPKSNQIIYDDHTLYIIPFQTHSQMFPASFWGNHCPLPRTLCWTFTLTTELQSSPGIQVWRHQLRECQGLRPTIRSLDKKNVLHQLGFQWYRFNFQRDNQPGPLFLWKSPFGAPGWKPGAGASFLNPILAKFSPKNVRPQLFIFWPLFTCFRILILNKPWSQRISSEESPLESIFAIGWAQVV